MSRDPSEIAARWMRWAAEDLTLAERNAADHDVVPRGPCIFAHQATEKARKALLAVRGIDPPKLHDLDRLAARLPEADNALFDQIDLPELTRWAIEGQYPDDVDDATLPTDHHVRVGRTGARRVRDYCPRQCVPCQVCWSRSRCC